MKIYLINAASASDPLGHKEPFMPLAFPILAACAPAHTYVIKDLLNTDINTIDFKTPYDLVGISFRVSATETAFKLADAFKKLNRTVVLGGPQASAIPLKAKSHANAVVIGEAEELWPQLLEDYENNKLKDFYIASPAKKYKFTDYEVFFQQKPIDLSAVPTPMRHLIKKKYTFDVTYAARGCPVGCSFCAVPSLFGSKMRYRKISDVVHEVKYFKKRYSLLDDNIFGRNDSYEYYRDLYTGLLKLKKKRYWTGQANLNAAAHPLGQQVIALAAQTGLTYAAIGFETLNKDDIKTLAITPKMGLKNKNNHLKEISDNIRYIQDQGVAISAWFTIGLKNDTENSVKESIKYCLHHHIFPVITPIQALEGTPLYDTLKRNGKMRSSENHVSNVNLSSLRDADYIKLMKLSLEDGYNTKRIIKNTLFFFRKNLALRKGFSNAIYKSIFVYITQKKLKKIIKHEIQRFKLRINESI